MNMKSAYSSNDDLLNNGQSQLEHLKFAAAFVAQQQQQQLLHNALTRTVSIPARVIGGHRKLERTQSEPLPQVQVNASR